MSRASLVAADYGPTNPTLPCEGTPSAAKIATVFEAAVLATPTRWAYADPSERVRELLTKNEAQLPSVPKQILARRADDAAKRALVQGGAVNVERRGDRAISGIGGHPDFALAGHLDPRGLSIVATPSTRNGESVLVPALSCAASTPRSDVDVVVTEHGVADLRGRTDAERHEALRAIFPTW